MSLLRGSVLVKSKLGPQPPTTPVPITGRSLLKHNVALRAGVALQRKQFGIDEQEGCVGMKRPCVLELCRSLNG